MRQNRPRDAQARRFDEACGQLLRQLRVATDVQTVAALRLVDEGAEVEFVEDFGFRLRPGEVIEEPSRWLLSDIRNSPERLTTLSGRSLAVSCAVVVALPLVEGQQRALVVLDPVPRRDLPVIQELATGHADMLATTLAFEAQMREVERMALTDDLTGLGNRRYWSEMLGREEARCARHGLEAAVAVIDINDLKDMNDSHGHHAGDEYLVRAAAVLRSSLRKSDFVARLGGDEFGVLMTHTEGISAQRVTEILGKRLEHAEIDAAVGVAIRSEHSTLDDAWRAADETMYEAKRAGHEP